MAIQTPSKIEEGRFEDTGIQYFETCENSIVKEKAVGVDQELNPSHDKCLVPIESSSKPVKVYQRHKTHVKKLRLNIKDVLDLNIKKDQIIKV